MNWSVDFVNEIAEAEVRALPLDMQTHFARLTDVFRDHGLSAMRVPYARHLAGKLWELRLSGRGRHRAFDLCDSERQARRRASDVREEDGTNTAARDRDRAGTHKGDSPMRSVEAWKRKQMKNPEFKKAYDALEDEFALIDQLLKARMRAKLTQAQVARRMGTSQSAVARLESGRSPSLTSLRKYAKATGSKVEIRLPRAT